MAFTTIPSSGAKLRASVLSALVTEIRPLMARKTIDETIISSSTLQNDDELFLVVAANCVYRIAARINYNSGTTPDFKMAFTYPSGLTMKYAANQVPAAGSAFAEFESIETTIQLAEGAGADRALLIEGIVIVTTGGTLQIQWAQNTLTASNTIVRAGSYMELRRVS